jgi:SOS-response transcriptional repressor LexA
MTAPSVRARRSGVLKMPNAAPGPSADTYGMIVTGNDLAPRICDGDTLIVDPTRRPISGCHVVVWPPGEQGDPLVRKLTEPVEAEEKVGPRASMHVVVAIYRQE